MRFTVDKNESLVIRSASAKVVLRKGSVTKKNIIVDIVAYIYLMLILVNNDFTTS